MYLRIMNQLDVSCMGETIKKEIENPHVSETVFERVSHAVTVLDDAYGKGRKAFDMGGFVFLLTDTHDSKRMKSQILDCYALSEENNEYTEEICKGTGQEVWQEEMYLRSSDDAVVIIYVKETEDNQNE